MITYAFPCLCIWILTDAFKAYIVDSELHTVHKTYGKNTEALPSEPR